MKVIRLFLTVLLVTFLSTNLYAAEIAIKATPTLAVKEPTTTTVKEPVVAPTIATPLPTIAPTIKVPTTTLQVKEPAIAPVIKEPVLAAPTIKTPTIAPAIKEPMLAPAVKEPIVKAPTTIQVREPVAGIKDPGLMGVRGEQMMGRGKIDPMGGKGLDMTGHGDGLRQGIGLPDATGGKGMDFSDPASALGNRGPTGVDRNSIGNQFGLGNASQNPKGEPTQGGIGDSRIMTGGGDGGKKENWHMESEMNDYEDSEGNLRVTQTITGTNLDTGETITETTVHENGKSETHVVVQDSKGNVIAEETFSEDVDDDSGEAAGDNSETTPDPEGGSEPLPAEMEAMLQVMMKYKQDLKSDPQDTLTNPGAGGYSAAKGSLKGDLSTEGRLDPYINPGQDGGDGPTMAGGAVSVGDVRETLVNPGNAGVDVSPGAGNLNPNQPPGESTGGGNTQIGAGGLPQ